ncbi:hypothetical protein GGF31_009017 [Allomyces arbusculus]|nr:hypothetical protein GGF31_009017 [Allomyces arbusculus]
MNLQDLYARYQDDRKRESLHLDKSWRDASRALLSASQQLHDHVTESCTDALHQQHRVLQTAQKARAEVLALQANVAAWSELLDGLNGSLMELGDAEHYTAVLTREAQIVARAVELAVVEPNRAESDAESDASGKGAAGPDGGSRAN